MDGFWPELLFLILGFALGVVPSVLRHGFAMRGYCKAAHDVVEQVCEGAETYLKEGYKAPLYRVASDYYRDAFSALLYEGGLSSSEVSALLRFGSQADQMNRGLDQIHQHLANDKQSLVYAENQRIRIKSLQLVSKEVATECAESEQEKKTCEVDATIYDTASNQINSLCGVSWFGWIWRQITEPAAS